LLEGFDASIEKRAQLFRTIRDLIRDSLMEEWAGDDDKVAR
jgi:hypothetical protein